MSVDEYAEVSITVGGADISGEVIWAESSFGSSAAAVPGMCQITIRGGHSFNLGKDLIALWINGKKMWWGYLYTIDQGYIFPDSPQPKTILHGIDLNILFDKLFMYNRANPKMYPDGGGQYSRQVVRADDGTVIGWMVVVTKKDGSETTDKEYIGYMLQDFDIDKVHPRIKWGQPPDPPSDSRIDEISVINPGGSPWTPPAAGTSLRAAFQDVSNNILRDKPGSAVWYIDPEGYINYRSQDFEAAPFTVGDGPGAVAVRDLTVTTDISTIKNDVIVFSGQLDPREQSTQEFIEYVHNSLTASVNLYGRFQWSETMGADWMHEMLVARSNKILFQEGMPAMRAEFTTFKSGLYPGQIVNIASGTHMYTTFDPSFGTVSQSSALLPIRAINMTFPEPNIVAYRATCSYDTQDPWGLLLALKRAPSRGLVSPNFNVMDRTNPGTYITASGMILVKEYAQQLSALKWHCTYAYIRNSITVIVGGKKIVNIPIETNRLTNIPDGTGPAGFKETDPDKGDFELARPAEIVYVEYHVWHNLDKYAI